MIMSKPECRRSANYEDEETHHVVARSWSLVGFTLLLVLHRYSMSSEVRQAAILKTRVRLKSRRIRGGKRFSLNTVGIERV